MNIRFFLILGTTIVCSLGIACAYSLKTTKKAQSQNEIHEKILVTEEVKGS